MPKQTRQLRHPQKAAVAAKIQAEKEASGPHHDVSLVYPAEKNVTVSFLKSLLDLIGHDISGPRRLYSYAQAKPGGPFGLAEVRNKAVDEFLTTQAEWLFLIDADMGFTPDSLSRLLAAADPRERPVVGGLCFAQREGIDDGFGGYYTYPTPTIFTWMETKPGIHQFNGQRHYPVNRMLKVDATGTAFLLIHRSAVERIGSDWFTLMEGEDGKLQGEDISFCKRLRDLEIPIFVHTGIRTTHLKNFWLSESDFWKSMGAPPATERVDVIVPTLGKRLENIPKLIRSMRSTTGLATAWYVVEPGDDETIDAVHAEGGLVIQEAGTFAHKVNTAYRYLGQRPADRRHPHTAAPWMLLVGDDVSFQPGWFDQALDVAGKWGGDVIGTNDLLNPRVMRGEHATHPIIRRSYVDEQGASWDGPGIVCHEGYKHCFVDDEWTLVAKSRGGFQMALGSYVPHAHPMGGKVPEDEVYKKGMASFDEDQTTFQRRVKEASANITNPLKVLTPV